MRHTVSVFKVTRDFLRIKLAEMRFEDPEANYCKLIDKMLVNLYGKEYKVFKKKRENNEVHRD